MVKQMKISKLQQSKIRKLAKKYPLVTIYIFGSQASGKIGPLSDYDIAILLDQRIKSDKYYHLQLRILSELNSILASDRVDLVILNKANTILAMKIITEGKTLFSCDEISRIAFEARTISRYQDRSFYEERYNKILFRQIAATGV